MRYDTLRKFNYFLAKHFGIVEYCGKYCIPSYWYVYDRDLDDDRCIDYEAVDGWQIFPTIKRVEQIPLGHDSLYRSYIQKFCKERKTYFW